MSSWRKYSKVCLHCWDPCIQRTLATPQARTLTALTRVTSHTSTITRPVTFSPLLYTLSGSLKTTSKDLIFLNITMIGLKS